jgi:hypothetical protein
MAKPEAVFIYIGTYPSEVAARADYDVVKDLHAVGAAGIYDAAVVTKDDAGRVHENRDEASRNRAGGPTADTRRDAGRWGCFRVRACPQVPM